MRPTCGHDLPFLLTSAPAFHMTGAFIYSYPATPSMRTCERKRRKRMWVFVRNACMDVPQSCLREWMSAFDGSRPHIPVLFRAGWNRMGSSWFFLHEHNGSSSCGHCPHRRVGMSLAYGMLDLRFSMNADSIGWYGSAIRYCIGHRRDCSCIPGAYASHDSVRSHRGVSVFPRHHELHQGRIEQNRKGAQDAGGRR